MRAQPNAQPINQCSLPAKMINSHFSLHFVSTLQHFFLPSVCFDRCIGLFDRRKNRLGWLGLEFFRMAATVHTHSASIQEMMQIYYATYAFTTYKAVLKHQDMLWCFEVCRVRRLHNAHEAYSRIVCWDQYWNIDDDMSRAIRMF